MNASLQEFNSLLEKYLDLQQRVTKFSSVEQDLINIRDLLDQELVSYKRLQNFSESALEELTADEFHRLVTEAIVDIFEVQSSIIWIQGLDEQSAVGAAEGIDPEIYARPDFQKAIQNLKNELDSGVVKIINLTESNDEDEFSGFARIIAGKFEESAISVSVVIMGIISHNMDKLYPNFNAKKQTIFGIFLRQLQATYANRVRNQELKKTNSELDSFVYSVSHDLRAPLLSLKGIIDLISETENLPGEVNDYLKMANTSVTRLDNNIQEILEYSRNARLAVKPEWFNLKTLTEQIFSDLKFSVTQPLELIFDFESGEDMFSDPRRIKVLMNNILANSVKYRRRNIPDAFVKISFKETSTHYLLSIQDNGEGIPEESKSKVFEMFYRASTSNVGTGLGLYICKEIMQKLSGTIRLESELGVGTTVFMTIPKKKTIEETVLENNQAGNI